MCMKNKVLYSYYEAQQAEHSFNSIFQSRAEMSEKFSECEKFLCATRHLCLILILPLTSSEVSLESWVLFQLSSRAKYDPWRCSRSSQ